MYIYIYIYLFIFISIDFYMGYMRMGVKPCGRTNQPTNTY